MSETMSADIGATETPASEPTDYDAVAQHLGLDQEADDNEVDNESLPPPDDAEPDSEEADGEDAEEDDGEREKVRLKVNGKIVTKSLDEVKKLAQMQIAGDAKLERAKKEIEEARSSKVNAEKQMTAVKSLLQVLQQGDMDTIAEFAANHLNAGETFNRAVIQYALKLYEMSKMSPEQREAMENRKLVDRYKREAEDRQKQDQERAMEYRVNQWSQHIATEVPKAIAAVGLPDTDFVREQVISTWRTALEARKNPTAQAVAAFVKQRLEGAKMLNGAGAAPKPAAPVRPKATKESVGLKTPRDDSGYYESWDEWRKMRGR